MVWGEVNPLSSYNYKESVDDQDHIVCLGKVSVMIKEKLVLTVFTLTYL